MNKFYFFLLITLVDVFVAGAQTETPSPPGRLFDAGGHKLHLNIQGSGSPAVIFENGSGDFSFVWSLVQPDVSKFATTVSYDRAGFAWSEPGPSPRSGRQIAFELHTALLNAGIKGPYILVGQSFGGFLVRNYARFYPNEVAGIVLVEALHENSRIIIGKDPMRIREWAKGLTAPEPLTAKTSAGIRTDSIMMDTTIEFPFTNLPKQAQQWQVWAQSHLIYRQEAGNEMNWSPEDVADMYKNRQSPKYMLGNMPLIVLTRGEGGYNGRADSAELETERLDLQKKLSQLSTNSKWIVDKKSGHNIHLEDPELVIRSVKEVVEAVRRGRKLSSE